MHQIDRAWEGSRRASDGFDAAVHLGSLLIQSENTEGRSFDPRERTVLGCIFARAHFVSPRKLRAEFM